MKNTLLFGIGVLGIVCAMDARAIPDTYIINGGSAGTVNLDFEWDPETGWGDGSYTARDPNTGAPFTGELIQCRHLAEGFGDGFFYCILHPYTRDTVGILQFKDDDLAYAVFNHTPDALFRLRRR